VDHKDNRLLATEGIICQRFPKIPLRWGKHRAIFSLLVSFIMPPEKLFFEPFAVRPFAFYDCARPATLAAQVTDHPLGLSNDVP